MYGVNRINLKRVYKYIRGGLTNLEQIIRGYGLVVKRINFSKPRKVLPISFKDMRGIPRRRSLDLAEKLICGQLAVDYVFADAPEYSKSNFDWNISFSEAATTFQLYIQALNPVGDLAVAYNAKKQKKYFELAKWFLDGWRSFSMTTASLSNEYIWEHLAVSLRTENVLYFFLVGSENRLFSDKEIKSITALLEMHGNFLSNPKNYLEKHNHGVFEDKALLYLAAAFTRPEWTHIAQSRLNNQWDFLFNDEMVCVENSYTYQRVNIDLFLEVARFQNELGYEWGNDLIHKLSDAQDFMGYGLRPNGTSAPFGDSFVGDYSNWDCISPEGVMAYASRRGKKGLMPKSRSVVYPKSGYYFAREHWMHENSDIKFEDAVWTMFRSGFSCTTHRQADDNSFLLFAKNRDIFVDSGLYTYMHRNPIRVYMRSANAHNTVIVDETSFPFQREDLSGLCGIIHHDVGLDRGFDYIVGYNSMYLGVFHVRHFVFLEDALFILDEIESVHEHCFSQLFHCGKDISLEKVDGDGFVGNIDDTGFRVKLSQMGDIPTVSVINGGSEGAKYGFWSDVFNEYFHIDTVKFDLLGSKKMFATLIYFEEGLDLSLKNPGFEFDSSSRTLLFVKHGEKRYLTLKHFDRQEYTPWQAFVMENYEISQNGCVFIFRNTANYEEKMQYAWYLQSKKTRKYIDKSMYSDSPSYQIDFSPLDFGDYSIRAFVMCKRNKKYATQIIAHVVHDENKCSYRRELEFDETWKTRDIILKLKRGE